MKRPGPRKGRGKRASSLLSRLFLDMRPPSEGQEMSASQPQTLGLTEVPSVLLTSDAQVHLSPIRLGHLGWGVS